MAAALSAVGRILSGQIRVIWVPIEHRQAVLNLHSSRTKPKHFVTQIRHQFTEYDAALEELGRLPRSCQIYQEIRNRVLRAIAETYPEYAEAACLQMLGKIEVPDEAFSDAVSYENPPWLEATPVRSLDDLGVEVTPEQRIALQMLIEGYLLSEIAGTVELKVPRLHGLFQQIRQKAHKSKMLVAG